MDPEALYQEVLLDHAKRPRNREPLRGEEVLAEGKNPLCGDSIRLALSLDGGRVGRVRYDGKGCALSIASASLMSEAARGRTAEELRALAARVARRLHGDADAAGEDLPEEIRALEGVRQFPMRAHCVTMCWRALSRALSRAGGASRG